MTKFSDYSFDDPDTFYCERVEVANEDGAMALTVYGLSPSDFVSMIKRWDDDAIEALIAEIKPEGGPRE